MAFYAGCRIDSSIDLVLGHIVAAVREIAGDIFLVLVARFYFLAVRMTIGAIGLAVAQQARAFLLIRIEFVPPGKVRVVVHGGAVVGMAIAAHLGPVGFSRMPGRH